MTYLSTALAALALAAMASPTLAHDITAPGLRIVHPWIALPPASAPTAAGYLSITNTGERPERFIGAQSDLAAMVMLHESRVDAQGVSTMAHLMAVEIAPGETVTFAPGGKHIMFIGLQAPLANATLQPATLLFEHAGPVAVEFAVEAAQAGMATMTHEAAKP